MLKLAFISVLVVVAIASNIHAQRGGGVPFPPQRGAARGEVNAPRARGGVLADIQTRAYLFKDTNETLEYNLFVSTKVSKTKKNPLIVALHGAGVPPGIVLRDLADHAQDGGYIVAAPMGYNMRGYYGAAGPGTPGANPPNLGELSEKDVLNVLDLVRQEFNVDEHRIYLVGQSMGGAGAVYLGIKYKTIWAAIGASAPAITIQHEPAELEGAVELPMIVLHGSEDRTISLDRLMPWVDKMKELKMTYEYRNISGAAHSDTLARGARYIFDFFKKHSKP